MFILPKTFFIYSLHFFYRFGCKIVSPQTGIILNDGMDDFSVPGKKNAYGVPPSPANFIRPQKMPLSSMCPSIMLDGNRDVELTLGAAGGSKITSSVAYVMIYILTISIRSVSLLRIFYMFPRFCCDICISTKTLRRPFERLAFIIN